jgi:hypothetical protein
MRFYAVLSVCGLAASLTCNNLATTGNSEETYGSSNICAFSDCDKEVEGEMTENCIWAKSATKLGKTTNIGTKECEERTEICGSSQTHCIQYTYQYTTGGGITGENSAIGCNVTANCAAQKIASLSHETNADSTVAVLKKWSCNECTTDGCNNHYPMEYSSAASSSLSAASILVALIVLVAV